MFKTSLRKDVVIMSHNKVLVKTVMASLSLCLGLGVSQVITNDKVFAEDTDNNGSVEKFDKYKGHQVYEYSVQNKSGLKISVLNQGGTLHGIYVPNGNDDKQNILLSFKHTKQYYSKDRKSTRLNSSHVSISY